MSSSLLKQWRACSSHLVRVEWSRTQLTIWGRLHFMIENGKSKSLYPKPQMLIGLLIISHWYSFLESDTIWDSTCLALHRISRHSPCPIFSLYTGNKCFWDMFARRVCYRGCRANSTSMSSGERYCVIAPDWVKGVECGTNYFWEQAVSSPVLLLLASMEGPKLWVIRSWRWQSWLAGQLPSLALESVIRSPHATPSGMSTHTAPKVIELTQVGSWYLSSFGGLWVNSMENRARNREWQS